ncbi:unnamed protein product [Cylicocyclus nassatus]|uniref:G-protein coupled receptors family 1 profile domain-containing protein n=1 Tax=Cylicocyclus nassatus TaxID=53992 RepID=A0AA36HED8_CYLNA|nr:unnamed protein product [Cylicocyclus nassatus]
MDESTLLDMPNITDGPCDVDTHPNLRLAFISFGSVISVVGCACNLLLLFVFLFKGASNPFQTFLAFLDFMLCFLFITCFGALTLSITFRIKWIYTTVKMYNVHMLIASRIVQLCIPYILIANTAYRLASITGKNRHTSNRMTQAVVLMIATTAVFLRFPGYFFIQVVRIENCDLFESLTLSGKERDPYIMNLYRTSDVFIQTKRNAAEEEERREHKRLRCAVKTTIVIISSYLACNSVNFVLYCIEMFNSSLTQDEDGNFNVFYVSASDLGTNLFVLSSTIRIFVYYKYNPQIRQQIQGVTALNCLLRSVKKDTAKSEPLIAVSL